MGKKFGFSFSWKRAVGISAAKGKLSRMLGVPLTRSGRERKLGRWLLGGSKANGSPSSEGDGGGGGIGCVGTIIVAGLVCFGAASWFKNSSISRAPMDTPAAAKADSTAVVSMPRAATTPRPVPTGPASVAAQQRAMAKYPQLSVKDSLLNRAFIEHIRRHQTDKPEVFDNSEWPTVIAAEAAASLK